ncbi:glycoside hydrolase family 3 C-terminal domain-containing protein [Actinoplanes sp. NPDC049316]|uniref:glycoside hydrolase family 3 protein n=1 Tax=Actinoplanes sp. NPDC049316 TaxID=3154727 RepID=UPI003426D452
MTASAFSAAVAAVRAGASPDTAAEDLLRQLTPGERLGLLDGDLPFWDAMADMLGNGYNRTPYPMGRVDRLGIPGLLFSDGPRGVVMGASTAFPVSMARGATWDVSLEERVGTAIGRELRAQGANFFGGVCINLPRHPAWGRSQETYGEDPVLLGEFGAALTRSVQRHAMAVAKHYALNSMENARFTVDVTADDAALHEVYLAHFRRVVDEGVAGIMTAYNSVNGEWAGQNEDLMEGVLRRRWGFTGVTVSDFIWGLRDAATSLRAGLDVEEPFQQQRAEHLPADLAGGRASWDDVDRAARRILRTQIHHYATREQEEPSRDEVFSDAHRALAREVAGRSMVLLKNETVAGSAVLPLRRDDISSVAVIGRLADLPNTGDHGSSDVRAPEVVTPLRGLTEALPDATIRHVADDSPDAAAEAARACDVAVVIVGYTALDEGEYIGSAMFADPALLALFPPADDSPTGQELLARLTEQAGTDLSIVGSQGAGGDRASLRLRPVDAEIIRAVAAANPRTVVAVVTAGAVITEEWRDAAPAVLLAWYSGCEGGRALADVLLGETDPAGRLPFSIPTTEDHLPFFDRDATAITYDKWFGQRLLDRDGHRAAFPLGFGLSYTSFTLSDLEVGPVTGETFDATVTVTNTGTRDGRHVVQLYGLPTAAGDDFPARVLLGFASVAVPAGQSVPVTVPASVRPLQRWTGDGFAPAADTATIEAAAYAGDPDAVTAPSPLPCR